MDIGFDYSLLAMTNNLTLDTNNAYSTFAKKIILHERFPDVQVSQVTLDEDVDLATKEGIKIYSAHLFLKDFV